jgi:hypothetical protein
VQTDSVKYTKKNEAAKPFEAGGEASLEFYCNRGNCSLFMLAGHTKKRPHNLVLGRLYDFHMYDMLELGVDKFTPMKAFPGASKVQAGNKVRREGGRAWCRQKAGAAPRLGCDGGSASSCSRSVCALASRPASTQQAALHRDSCWHDGAMWPRRAQACLACAAPTSLSLHPDAPPLPCPPQPCMIFVGDKFESEGPMKLAKSMLLDVFRGQEVDNINLAGLDHVVVAVALDSSKLLLRQYAIKLKKSGTKVGRCWVQGWMCGRGGQLSAGQELGRCWLVAVVQVQVVAAVVRRLVVLASRVLSGCGGDAMLHVLGQQECSLGTSCKHGYRHDVCAAHAQHKQAWLLTPLGLPPACAGPPRGS